MVQKSMEGIQHINKNNSLLHSNNTSKNESPKVQQSDLTIDLSNLKSQSLQSQLIIQNQSHYQGFIKIQNHENQNNEGAIASQRSNSQFYQNNSPRFIQISKQTQQNDVEDYIQILREQNISIKEQYKQLKQFYDELLSNSKLSTQKGNQQVLSRLLQQNKKLQQQLYQYQQQRQQSLTDKKLLQQQIDQVSNRNQQLFNQLRLKTQQFQKLKKQLTNLNNHYETSLIYQNDNIKQDNINLLQQLKNDKQQIQNLKSLILNLQSRLQTQYNTNDKLTIKLKDTLSQKDNLQLQFNQHINSLQNNQGLGQMNGYQLKRIINQQNNQIEKYRQQNQFLICQIQNISKQLQEIRIKYQDLIYITQQKDNIVKILTQQKNKLEQEIQIIRNKSSRNRYIVKEQINVKQGGQRSKKSYRQEKIQQHIHINLSGNNSRIVENQQQIRVKSPKLQTYHKEVYLKNMLAPPHEQNVKLNKSKSYEVLSSQKKSLNKSNTQISHEANLKNIREIKKWISKIQNQEITNNLLHLINEMYLDVQYRQRINLKLKEMVIDLQNKINNIQQSQQSSYNQPTYTFDNHYITKLQNSIKKYERLIDDSTKQKLQLLNQITHLQRMNLQMKRTNYRNSDNNQTQNLIQELTAKLSEQKLINEEIMKQNEQLKIELIQIQKQLNNKNHQVKLLTLNKQKKQLKIR